MTDPLPILTIKVISDVMCPWCFIGQKNLDAARALASEVPLSIQWSPYQLDPTLPEAGKDRQKYLSDKFGGREQAREIYQRIEQAGRDVGIDFQFEKIKVSPNTLNAHILIEWAGQISQEVQNHLVRRLFELYFLEGENIGDLAVLAKAGRAAGMSGNIINDLGRREEDKKTVHAQLAHARAMGVNGVPFFVIAEKYALSGAQPPQTLAQAIRQIWAEMKENAAYSNQQAIND